MPPAHVNRDEVERRTDALLDTYGDVPVDRVRESIPAIEFPNVVDACRDGYVGSGYAWVVRDPDEASPLTESMPDDLDKRQRVLMILGRGATRWGLPGGGLEGDESYEEAAVREVREETGVECEVTDPFLIRRFELVSAGDHDEVLHTCSVFFDASYAGGRIEVQAGELNGAAWFAEPPAQLLPENEFRAATFWGDYEAEDPLANGAE